MSPVGKEVRITGRDRTRGEKGRSEGIDVIPALGADELIQKKRGGFGDSGCLEELGA